MMKHAWLTLALMSMVGCADERLVYAGTEFDVQSAPPSPVSFEPDRIELVAGVAVKVLAMPRSRGELRYTELDLVTLHSDDPNVFGVYQTEDERSFVVVGATPGQSCLEVSINWEREECIAVRVLPQVTE